MQRLIRRVWKEFGTTILFVTHNTAEAVFLGTRVIALAKESNESGSKVALDVAVPEHDSPEEIADLVRYIEGNSTTGEESAVEEVEQAVSPAYRAAKAAL
jgi:NitT/TauT family transport system ATP-binding protein